MLSTSATAMNFYKVTPVKEWTCNNVMNYYCEELNILKKANILDDIKKNLQKVAKVNSGFDATCRIKVQELIDNWKILFAKDWVTLVKKIHRSSRINKKIEFVDDSQKRSLDNYEQMDEEALAKKAKLDVEAEDTNPNANLVCDKNRFRLLILQHTSLSNSNQTSHETNNLVEEKNTEEFIEMKQKDFRDCGLEMRPTMRLADLSKELNDQNKDSKLNRDLCKLLNGRNKSICAKFQNIKGDIEKIRHQIEKIDNTVKSLEQRNDIEGSEFGY
ncbi:13479_t:CDS:2 [Funneliformis caledonium]|uniref:13479_t:CDS:1 n=1 Tax=Funneliformis caledonium TaxID=1117310 RepID=A0A9N9CPT9_9GLOM|nr:13479_t:CDS:2 [Funneliformis caledonium]